ncbi:hypothetical protein D9M69_511940 [compost metagenome]
MTERTRTLSVTPGTCAGRMQAPRTMMSILAPSCEANASARARGSSVRAFILRMMRASLPALAAAPAASTLSSMVLCR